MACDREAIFAALFTRMQTITGVAYFSRIFKGESELGGITEQPAMLLVKGDERVVDVRGFPPHWELGATIIIAARVQEKDTSIAPSTILNGLITKVEAMLERTPTEGPAGGAFYSQNPDLMYGTTLGGLCTSVRFAGDISVDEGAVGLQGLAIIPLVITAAR